MAALTHGIHHVTAMAGDAQKNVDFYVGILGLRMLKKTINFDDPFTYHFYFGDHGGQPGTIMTFFPWSSRGMKGRQGAGQVTVTSFSVAKDALDYWIKRLEANKIIVAGPFERMGESVIAFDDFDGLSLEIVAAENDERPGLDNGDVPSEYSIKGFHSVTLLENNYQATAAVLNDRLGFREAGNEENRYRYISGDGSAGTIVDIIHQPDATRGIMGVGTVHHVAWRITDDDDQLVLRKNLVNAGFNVSPVMDRNYFHSIYFREPGGVLFEGATDPPGFTVDESLETLGAHLKLPPWMEENREEIEKHLPKIVMPGEGKNA